jgi:hypothetical protein
VDAVHNEGREVTLFDQRSSYSESSEIVRGEPGGDANSHDVVQGMDVSADCTRQPHLLNLQYSCMCFMRPGGVFIASSSAGEYTVL